MVDRWKGMFDFCDDWIVLLEKEYPKHGSKYQLVKSPNFDVYNIKSFVDEITCIYIPNEWAEAILKQEQEKSGEKKNKKYFYECLTKNLTTIIDVRLVFAIDIPEGFYISVFYDELADDYSKTELEIFEAYDECCRKIQNKHVDILVMIHTESIDIPKGSEILLKRKRTKK